MRYFITILFLIHFLTVRAQDAIVISGTVRDVKTHEALEAVNVMLQNPEGKITYGYALTDAQGCYSIKYTGKKDTISISISSFNIKGERRRIMRKSQQMDFAAESTTINIREVVIKIRPIERLGDTITYNVNSFLSATDHNISDVLRKMPGIEVDNSGKIKYNGLDISKFYIEGLDMFEGRYGIATNNIQAKDIARVEVLENYQPIKVLKELTLPNNAAINLRIKSSSKGIWSGILQLGAGYKPAMWNTEATAMYFGHKFQNMNVYKTNNTGNDISNELHSHYETEEEDLSPLSGIHKPTVPSIEGKRFIDNNIHLVSSNGVSKLNKNLNLVANAYYLHDQQQAEGRSTTTYYQPQGQPLVISEITEASQHMDHAGTRLQLESNTDAFYIKDQFSFTGKWDRDLGKVTSNKEEVTQHFKSPGIHLKNVFQGTRRTGDFSINLSSKTDYSTLPTTLQVNPMLFPEIFDNGNGISGAVQHLDSKRFRTLNNARVGFTVKRWSFYMKADINANLEWMQSALQAISNQKIELPVTKDLQNDAYSGRIDVSIGPSISYIIAKKLFIFLDCPFNFMHLTMKEKIPNNRETNNKLLVQPDLLLQLNINRNLKLSSHASYTENYGGIYDSYSGFIMTDYRIISNKQGEISHSKTQNYNLSLSYANIIQSLFGSINASYYHTKQNLMYGTNYKGNLSLVQAVAIPNKMDGYNLYGKISKYFSDLRTTLNVSGSYSRSWNDILRQNELMKVSFEYIGAGAGANIRFCPSVLLDYNVNYSKSRNYIKTEKALAPINMVRQNATLSFVIAQKTVFSISGEHYYNETIKEGNRTMFFLDAKVSHRYKRIEYSLEARNLLSKQNFFFAQYDDATNYAYTYRLRPPSVMFSIRFGL